MSLVFTFLEFFLKREFREKEERKKEGRERKHKLTTMKSFNNPGRVFR